MLESLMTPNGRLGHATVIIAFLLAVGGIVGIILGASGVGIEEIEDRVGAVIVGGIAIAGVAGLLMQQDHPLAGAVLAVAGSVCAALLNSWLIVPILLVPATAVVSIMRARRITRGAASRMIGHV